jgi:hypothetical protein
MLARFAAEQCWAMPDQTGVAGTTKKRHAPRMQIQFGSTLKETNMTKTLSAVAASLCVLSLSLGAYAASDEYKAAKKQTEADYKMAKAECKKLSGATKKDCMKKAHDDHEAAEDRIKALK